MFILSLFLAKYNTAVITDLSSIADFNKTSDMQAVGLRYPATMGAIDKIIA
jgi:hypothetical protein